MTRIVRTTYRYRRPSRRKKAAALEGSAVVKISEKTRRRVSDEPKTATSSHDATRLATETAATIATRAPAAIVTARKPGKRYVDVPDMTPEEQQRRGDAADALFREVVRRIAETT